MKIIAKIILILVVLSVIYVFFTKFSFLSEKRTLDFSGEKKISVNDNGLTYEISSKAHDIAGALAENNIQLSEKDILIPIASTTLYPGMTLTIERSAKVRISVDGENFEKDTLAKKVSAVLAENSIFLSPIDLVEPDLQTRTSDGLEIKITRKNTKETTIEEPIEFTVIKQKDSKVDWGEKTVTQKGEEGVRETTYKIDYENGKEVKKVKLASKITKKPINQIEATGTRLKTGKADSGIASWYNAGPNECAHRTFPPGTWLRVTNTVNGRQVFVRVAGYGPQAGTGKLIDLDNKAFKQLAPLGQGTAKVKVEEILSKGFSLE